MSLPGFSSTLAGVWVIEKDINNDLIAWAFPSIDEKTETGTLPSFSLFVCEYKSALITHVTPLCTTSYSAEEPLRA